MEKKYKVNFVNPDSRCGYYGEDKGKLTQFYPRKNPQALMLQVGDTVQLNTHGLDRFSMERKMQQTVFKVAKIFHIDGGCGNPKCKVCISMILTPVNDPLAPTLYEVVQEDVDLINIIQNQVA